MKTIQYTVRGVQPKLDQVIRTHARERGVSLNTALLDALVVGLNISDGVTRYHDLDGLAGTWVEDVETEAIFDSMREIDQDMWQ